MLPEGMLWGIWTRLLSILHGSKLVRWCHAENLQPWTPSYKERTSGYGGELDKRRCELSIQQMPLYGEQVSAGLQLTKLLQAGKLEWNGNETSFFQLPLSSQQKESHRSLTHELNKGTLLGGEVVRLLNTGIASSNHRLHTIVVNKKSLSGYDKWYILSDQVSTLPYGHSAIREDMFFGTIVNEPDWGMNELTESGQESGRRA